MRRCGRMGMDAVYILLGCCQPHFSSAVSTLFLPFVSSCLVLSSSIFHLLSSILHPHLHRHTSYQSRITNHEPRIIFFTSQPSYLADFVVSASKTESMGPSPRAHRHGHGVGEDVMVEVVRVVYTVWGRAGGKKEVLKRYHETSRTSKRGYRHHGASRNNGEGGVLRFTKEDHEEQPRKDSTRIKYYHS